jgi:hypothetical protein
MPSETAGVIRFRPGRSSTMRCPVPVAPENMMTAAYRAAKTADCAPFAARPMPAIQPHASRPRSAA